MTHCVRNLICDSPITKAISEELIFGTKFVEVVCLVREVKMNFSYQCIFVKGPKPPAHRCLIKYLL